MNIQKAHKAMDFDRLRNELRTHPTDTCIREAYELADSHEDCNVLYGKACRRCMLWNVLTTTLIERLEGKPASDKDAVHYTYFLVRLLTRVIGWHSFYSVYALRRMVRLMRGRTAVFTLATMRLLLPDVSRVLCETFSKHTRSLKESITDLLQVMCDLAATCECMSGVLYWLLDTGMQAEYQAPALQFGNFFLTMIKLLQHMKDDVLPRHTELRYRVAMVAAMVTPMLRYDGLPTYHTFLMFSLRHATRKLLEAADVISSYDKAAYLMQWMLAYMRRWWSDIQAPAHFELIDDAPFDKHFKHGFSAKNVHVPEEPHMPVGFRRHVV